MYLYIAIYSYIWYNIFGGSLMKLTISRSKNSESFYIQKSFVDENGKSTSKTVRKLGNLHELSELLDTDRDGVIAWAKDQVRLETEKEKHEDDLVILSLSQKKRIPKGVKRSFNCGYLYLQALLTDLRLDNICRNIRNRYNFQFDIHAILSDLIYARILQPSSKLSSYKFCMSLLEPPKYMLHDVYRALSVLAKESDYIQAELYKNSNFIHNRNKKILYYDCTNYYFEIEQESGSKKYGKGKQHQPNPIIGMGLFMDTDGIPLAFSLYPGNQNEQLTLKPLERKVINDFDCSEFIYCSDSGLGSASNKLLNHTGGRSYVVTQSLKKMKKEDREIALKPTQFRKIGSEKFIDISTLDENDEEVYNSIYYKEIPLDNKKLNETIIVTYSPKYRAYQSSIREGQIQRAQKMLTENGKIKKNRKNPNDPARFIKKTSVTENGEAADEIMCELDYEVIENEKKYDGFYAVATDVDGDIEEVIKINQGRWQIEECFRIMKTEFSARPINVSLEDHIEAHFLTCFIALLVYRLLEIKLDKKYTIEKTIDCLKAMRLNLFTGEGYAPDYERTDLTDDLYRVFGFHTDYEFIRKSKLRSIIKQTKERKNS